MALSLPTLSGFGSVSVTGNSGGSFVVTFAGTLSIIPPAQGRTYPIPNNDLLTGDDGNDTIIVTGGLNQIFGGQGNNTFIAEPTEVMDTSGKNTGRWFWHCHGYIE